MIASKPLPVGFLIVLVLMALAALGLGYARWSERLITSGSIQTGNIDIRIENILINETDPMDAASCSFLINQGQKTMTILVDSAYPAYTCAIDFNLVNFGTIPARITGVKMPGTNREFGILPSGALISKPVLYPSTPSGAGILIRVRPETKQSAIYEFEFGFEIGIDISQGNVP